MSNSRFSIAAAIAAVTFTTVSFTAGAALAQQGGGHGGPGGGMMARYDTDGDGKISLKEYEAGRMNGFKRLDTDGNGAVSFAEIDAAAAQAAARGGDMGTMMQSRIEAMKAADTNNDQSISADEYNAYSDAEFKKLDTNGDGFVTADEMQAGMGGMGGHHQ